MTKFRTIIRTILIWALVTCAGIAHEASAAFPTFTSAVELKTLSGEPVEKNDLDIRPTDPVSAGYGAAGTLNDRPVRWAADGSAIELPLPAEYSGGYVYVYGINNAGQVVGTMSPGRAVRWEANGSPTLLAPPPGPNNFAFFAYGINNLGQSVGQAGGLSFGDRAARWAADGSCTVLGDVPGQTNHSVAYNISDTGIAVGYVEVSDIQRAAVRWAADGSATLLGRAPGQRGNASYAHGVNNAGGAVGYADLGIGAQAVRWAPDGSATLLADLPGLISESSVAYGITNDGLIGGYQGLPDIGPRAVIWDADGTPSMLQDLMADGNTWIFTRIEGINADATTIRVLAIGSKNGAPVNYYLVEATVPEPGGAALLLLAGFLLFCLHRARRSRRSLPAFIAASLPLLTCAPSAHADIFQWEYVNPSDPSQGKQQSATLAPGGAGVNAEPGAYLSNLDLTKAYLIWANLGPQILSSDESGYPIDYVRSNLTNAILRQADLSYASFVGATLTGADLTGAEVRGAAFGSFNGLFNFGGTGITSAQLYSTASYQARDLTRIGLAGNNSVAGIDLVRQNLTGAYFATSMHQANLSQANLRFATFYGGDLTGANLSGAEVRGAYFNTNVTTDQLYSTASYQAHDLTGIGFPGVVLTGVDFSEVNLTGADFRGTNLAGANLSHSNLANAIFRGNYFYWGGANLSGANLSHANLTNANFAGDNDSPGANLANANLTGADARRADFHRSRIDGAITTNLIQSDGHIEGLNLTSGASLIVRDYDGHPEFSWMGPLPIVLEDHLTMDATGTLRLVFDADPWDSTISFAPGIPVTRGGTLELSFAPDVNLAAQIGRTIDLFDWTGTTPAGAFIVSSPYAWNLTKLHTTGEVTLTAIPILAGDFNHDGAVDAADYVVWRKNPGGIYTQDDFNTWRANFGRIAGNGASLISVDQLPSAVPEPAALVLIGITLAGLGSGIARRQWNENRMELFGCKGGRQ